MYSGVEKMLSGSDFKTNAWRRGYDDVKPYCLIVGINHARYLLLASCDNRVSYAVTT